MKCYPHLSHWKLGPAIFHSSVYHCAHRLLISPSTHNWRRVMMPTDQGPSHAKAPHSYCFPMRPSQVENIILKPSSNDIFLPKLNFWSTLEAVWHSQENYEGEVDSQSQLCKLVTPPSSISIHTAKGQGDRTPGTLWKSSSRHSDPELVSKCRSV